MNQGNTSPFSMGSRISHCRQNKNMTQEEMALRLGVTPQAVSKWERNQSFPDTAMLADICNVLEINADYLLGMDGTSAQIMEREDAHIQNKIWSNLRNSLEPLELVFGKAVVPFFANSDYVEKIIEVRERLAAEGILMPIVRIKDMLMLDADEYMILSYQRVLFRGTVKETETVDDVIGNLEKTVRERYADILNSDLIRQLVENLKIRFPSVIEGIVPDRISYGLLKDVMKGFMARGNSMMYLPRVIEMIEAELRRKGENAVCGNRAVEDLVDVASRELETEDNFWAVMQQRK